MLSFMTELSDEGSQIPERHCFGQALEWLETVTPVVKRINRKKWSLRFADVANG